MDSPTPRAFRPAPPAVGISFEGRPTGYLAALGPLVDVVEVVPDCLVRDCDGTIDDRWIAELEAYAPNADVVYHGVGLSLGTASGWNEEYLTVLERVCALRAPRWHSEHLGFTTVDGHFLGTMPALPATREAADLVVERSIALRLEFGLEFLLEHVATPLARPDELTRAEFLNYIGRNSGCGLILDLHNLECDADNGQLSIPEFLDELDGSLVREIHVAGGIWRKGYHLDVHARIAQPSTEALLQTCLGDLPNVELVVFEVLADALPALELESVVGQILALRLRINRALAA